MQPEWPKSSSRDCLESPDGHQTGATQANIEGQGDRIFALQASDLASLTPLQPTFQTVSLRASVLAFSLSCFGMLDTISTLELPSIGWQLFILDSSQSDPIALPAFLDTYATRLLTEPLRRWIPPSALRVAENRPSLRPDGS